MGVAHTNLLISLTALMRILALMRIKTSIKSTIIRILENRPVTKIIMIKINKEKALKAPLSELRMNARVR